MRLSRHASRLLALLAAVVVTVSLAPSSSAAEVYTRPGSGELLLEGRGYGHGRGLSQWGAYGAADQGLTWQQIVDFYYPGTTRTVVPAAPIRVHISADNDNEVRVVPTPGLALRTSGGSEVLPTGSQFAAWRLLRSGSSLVLQRLDGATWHPHATTVALGSSAGFTAGTGTVPLVLPNGNRQSLRGEVRAVVDGTSVRSVAVMPMDDYLRGVVPAEMPASWHTHALRAQAVAARSYAARLRHSAASKLWDTCDTTSCQVFRGTAVHTAAGSLVSSGEHARTDEAIAATANVVLMHSGVPALTEFSAANGGWSASGGTSTPYLAARQDPYDGRVASSAHRWTTTVPVSTVEKKYPSIGRFQRLTVDQRNGLGELGGRVLRATFTGDEGSVTLTGDQIRSAFGLRSNWFTVTVTTVSAFPRDFSGDGVTDLLGIAAGGELYLYPGNGAGGFSARRQVGTGWGSRNLVTQAGDWDGDGTQDVIGRDPGTGNLWLYRGNGAGGFGAQGPIGGKWGSVDLVLGTGDWDGDGNPDLLARVTTDQSLRLYPGNGAGGFLASRQIGRSWGGLDLITAADDLDGDGQPDLVARHRTNGNLYLYRGDGNGGFASSSIIGVRWRSIDALVGPGDWTGDGSPDLLARTPTGELLLYRWNGSALVGPMQIGHGWGAFRILG